MVEIPSNTIVQNYGMTCSLLGSFRLMLIVRKTSTCPRLTAFIISKKYSNSIFSINTRLLMITISFIIDDCLDGIEEIIIFWSIKVIGGGLGSNQGQKLDFLDFDIMLKPWLSIFQNGLTCLSIPHSCRDMMRQSWALRALFP